MAVVDGGTLVGRVLGEQQVKYLFSSRLLPMPPMAGRGPPARPVCAPSRPVAG